MWTHWATANSKRRVTMRDFWWNRWRWVTYTSREEVKFSATICNLPPHSKPQGLQIFLYYQFYQKFCLKFTNNNNRKKLPNFHFTKILRFWTFFFCKIPNRNFGTSEKIRPFSTFNIDPSPLLDTPAHEWRVKGLWVYLLSFFILFKNF